MSETSPSPDKPATRYLSGIQPSGSGDLHLGNYFGAIAQHVSSQPDSAEGADPRERLFFIANYHALTVAYDHRTDPAAHGRFDRDAARARSRQVAATYLALGLDPARSTLFLQSDVPEVTELTWLLATVCGKGLLDRAHSFKDKTARGQAAGVGLFIYPVLMAADILAYDSDVVPVGEDQVQHLEMTRDMARGFNEVFGECFKLPETQLAETGQKVCGTDGQKMSKSYGNTIPIMLGGKKLKKTVMGIVTDSTPVEDPKSPEACNAFNIYKLFADEAEQAEMADRYRAGGLGYGDVKKAILERINDRFAEPRARYEALLAGDELDEILREGGQRARELARTVLDRARTLCGL